MFFYLLLRFILKLQVISSKIIGHYKFRSYYIGQISKYFIQYLIIDKRFAITLMIEPDTIFTKFNKMHRQTGNKSSHDSLHGVGGDNPDAEETLKGINAECIKENNNLLKTL